VLVEVKPAVTRAEYKDPILKMTHGLAGHWEGPVFIVGVDPFPTWGPAGKDPFPGPPMGLVGERLTDGETGRREWRVACWPEDVNFELLRGRWAEACNTTKWMPSS
jgi:hypothetical protein